MKRKHIYLLLAIIGFVVPYYFFISFLAVYGLDAKAFGQQLFGTWISCFFAVDLLLASVVFVIFLLREAEYYSIPYQWLYVAALCLVGLSFALPLFLYARESRIDSKVLS